MILILTISQTLVDLRIGFKLHRAAAVDPNFVGVLIEVNRFALKLEIFRVDLSRFVW